MIDTYGLAVTNAINGLSAAETIWSRVRSSGENVFNALKPNPTDIELETAKQMAGPAIRRARDLCHLLVWPDLLPEITRLENRLRYPPLPSAVAQDFRHLINSIRDRLSAEYFFHVERADVRLYGEADLFGAEVAAKFKLAEDIEAAGNCLALGQSTACVFHLMRIMEVALHRLGRVLQVKFEPGKQTWFQICNDATKAAVNRPAKTKAQRTKNASSERRLVTYKLFVSRGATR